MKTIKLTLLVILGLTSCSPNHSNKTKDSNDSIHSTTIKKQTTKVYEKSLLLGIWWDADEKDAPCASFEIKDSTIFYPDQEQQSEFKYQIKQDSMIVNMDGYISTSKIEKVTKDTLVLITYGEKQTFIKTK